MCMLYLQCLLFIWGSARIHVHMLMYAHACVYLCVRRVIKSVCMYMPVHVGMCTFLLICGHYFTSALLLSALKARGIPYTPSLIKRVLENTAVPLGSSGSCDLFSSGHGVLQVCVFVLICVSTCKYIGVHVKVHTCTCLLCQSITSHFSICCFPFEYLYYMPVSLDIKYTDVHVSVNACNVGCEGWIYAQLCMSLGVRYCGGGDAHVEHSNNVMYVCRSLRPMKPLWRVLTTWPMTSFLRSVFGGLGLCLEAFTFYVLGFLASPQEQEGYLHQRAI